MLMIQPSQTRNPHGAHADNDEPGAVSEFQERQFGRGHRFKRHLRSSLPCSPLATSLFS
jgi:hypothetical protein